jgi:signal transduction histidine kinase
MLFGGVNGLNVFDPDSLTDNPYVPPVVITAFRKAGQLVDLDAEVMTLRLLTLDHAESVFSFEFAALEYTQPLRNQYAYRMEGFDRDWVYCGTRREARYTNLDPGTYVFRVKAANNDGVWNPEPASITVVIVPPFWRTSLFVISSLVLSVLVLGAAIRYVSTRKLRMAVARLERQREISEERLRTRERIARDLHDDLASTVGSAGMYIELLRRQPGNGNSASLLERTASLLNDAKEAMADIVWSVSPRNDSVESLLARVSIHAADMCRAHGLKYEFDLPQEYPATVPDENLRRNVYLILKEAITNAVRHSGAGRIRFFSAVSGESLFCEVSDDGKGVDPGAGEAPVRHSGGFGMDNMRRRASEIGAQFEVTSTPDRGTAVRLTVRMTQSGY